MTDEQRFPADGRGILCGHNFPARQCPYAKCGYREALERLREVEETLRKSQRIEKEGIQAIASAAAAERRLREATAERDKAIKAYEDLVWSDSERIKALEAAARDVHKEAKGIMAIVPSSTELDGPSGIRVCNVEDLFEAKHAANKIAKRLAEVLPPSP